MKIIGLYKITNQITGQVYIGLSKDCKGRLSKHKSDLTWNRHRNAHLQSSWNKYGSEHFTLEVLLQCGVEELSDTEIKTIAEYRSSDPKYGFNNSLGGENNPPTEETRRKLSEACKKRAPASEETRRKISEANKGRKLTDEQRAAMSERFKGRKLSEEHKKKLAAKNER